MRACRGPSHIPHSNFHPRCYDFRGLESVGIGLIGMENMTRDFTSHSADETVELGRQLALQLGKSHVVLLRGDLGAGKTTLVKGIAEGFGAAEADEVTSPTFTLIHEYSGPERDVFHIDLYRLEKPGELDSLGLEDLMQDARNLLLIEWGEKFPRILQQKDAEIVIRRVEHDERRVRLTTAA